MRKTILFLSVIVASFSASPQRVLTEAGVNGALRAITIEGDTSSMNWLVRCDGTPAAFYDPFANDQDWALVFWLLLNE